MLSKCVNLHFEQDLEGLRALLSIHLKCKSWSQLLQLQLQLAPTWKISTVGYPMRLERFKMMVSIEIIINCYETIAHEDLFMF